MTSVYKLDLRVESASELFERVSSDLKLPDWFGRNWDALLEAITSAVEESGSDEVIFKLIGDGALAARLPHEHRCLHRVLEGASARSPAKRVRVECVS
jgi:RNAse (barnase) inhibitor barstar